MHLNHGSDRRGNDSRAKICYEVENMGPVRASLLQAPNELPRLDPGDNIQALAHGSLLHTDRFPPVVVDSNHQ